MRQVIRQTVNRDFAKIEAALACLSDVTWVAAGATLASAFFRPSTQGWRLEGGLLILDVALTLFLMPWVGVYDSRRDRSKWRFYINILFGWITVQVCGWMIMYLIHRTALISRSWCLSWTAITCVGILASRLVTHRLLDHLRHRGRNLRTVAIVGSGAHCETVITNIASSPDAGFRAVAKLYTCGSRHPPESHMHRFPSFQGLRDFAEWVRCEQVDEVWLALRMSEESTVLRVIDEFKGDLVNLRFIPDVRSVVMFDRNVIDLIGSPAINLMVSPMTPYALLQKAVFDRLFAFTMLVVLSPLMTLIAMAIKVTSKGPVFFTQRRMGVDGQVFRIYKFRSMRVHVEQPGVVSQATRGDPRVTPLGALLRRTSLDELPQFLNVLRGEMSVVGPRPHALEHDDEYRFVIDGYIHRYRIKPGITGWAQINGFRGETDGIEKMRGRVEHDLYYLRNWSFGLDVRIVLATVVKGFRHQNAY